MRALQLADASVDFTQFSRSGNLLELVIVVHAGPGAEGKPDSTNWIWSHNAALSSWGIPQANRIFDGVIVDQYTMQPERSAINNADQIEIGVFAHELGHALGLPDLYDVDGSSEGVGRYCLMSSGSWGVDFYNSTPHRPAHLSPWCKKFLGWITPQLITSDVSGLKLPPVQSTGQVLRLNTPAANEYFLIENRQWNGFDSLLDGEGLLIWHQDETVITNGFPSNQINVTESHKGVDLEQAKGTQSLDSPASGSNWANYNRGDYRDFYPYLTNASFTNVTTPNSNTYTGIASGVGVSNITAGGGDTMVCDIGIPGFTIGLLQSPAFPQYLTIAAVANSALSTPGAIDTALMQNPSGNQPLAFARIGATRSYQVDYELALAGTHNVHLAARDSANPSTWRRADRTFDVVSGKAGGGTVRALGGAVAVDLAPGALDRDLLLAVTEGAVAPPQGALPVSPAYQVGPGMALGEVSQISIEYDPAGLPGDPRRLGVYRAEGGAWSYLGGTLDEGGGRVLAEIDRLGVYQLAWRPDNPPLARLQSGAASGAKPNPFGTRTTISYQLARPSKVSLKIYNAAGQLVRDLEQGQKASGLHRAAWDGTDDGGRRVASGVYLYRLETDGAVKSGRMAKVR
jgi:M6 family metalloprotease-like protein